MSADREGSDRDYRPAADERFADWVDGRLPARELERFEAEMRVNARLRADAAEYRRTVEAVRQALREPYVRVDLADRVMAAIDEPAAQSAAAPAPLRLLPMLLSVAAAAAILVTGLLLVRWQPEDRPATDAIAQVPEDLRNLSSSAQPEPGGAPGRQEQQRLALADGERDRSAGATGRAEDEKAKAAMDPAPGRATQHADERADPVTNTPNLRSKAPGEPAALGVPAAPKKQESPVGQKQRVLLADDPQSANAEATRLPEAARAGARGYREPHAPGAELGGPEAKRADKDAGGQPAAGLEREHAADGPVQRHQEEEPSAGGGRGQVVPSAPATTPLPSGPTLPVVTLTFRRANLGQKAALPAAVPEAIEQFRMFLVAGAEAQSPGLDPSMFPYFQRAGAPQLRSIPVRSAPAGAWSGFIVDGLAGGLPASGPAEGQRAPGQPPPTVDRFVGRPNQAASVWLVEGRPDEVRRLLGHVGELARSGTFELRTSEVPAAALNLPDAGAAAPGSVPPEGKPAEQRAESRMKEVGKAVEDRVRDGAPPRAAAPQGSGPGTSSVSEQKAGVADQIRLLLVLQSMPTAEPAPELPKPVDTPPPRKQ